MLNTKMSDLARETAREMRTETNETGSALSSGCIQKGETGTYAI
jgi:hypothetical protein